MIFQDFCFEKEPELLIGGSYDWFELEENKDKKLCGVYAGVCLDNEKIYIGSSKDFKERLMGSSGHLKTLAKGKHKNPSFQNSFDKYGEKSVFWYWVEDVEEKEGLLKREFYYINYLIDNGLRHGRIFNHVRKFVESAQNGCEWSEKRRKKHLADIRGTEDPYLIKDPEGNIHEIGCSLKEFAAKHGMTRETLSMLLDGKQDHYMGWCSPYTPLFFPKKIHKVELIETCEVFEFESITEFSKERGIPYSTLNHLLIGTHKSSWGYKLPETVLEEKVYNLKSPWGEVFEFKNISEFAREHNLSGATLSAVLSGNLFSSKGWTKPENNLASWTFVSPGGEEFTTSSLINFARENGLTKAGMANMQRRIGATHRGWRFKSKTK